MVLPTPGGPMNSTLVASSKKRSVASSSTVFLSIDGWASKSKSLSRHSDGNEAKRSRLDRRRSSVASTSTASRRSRKAVWVSLVFMASSR